ncbi:hypothetical protein N9231_02510 [Saprospiraceae bacterium]|nr:hypothetical protein [Saprospiraceae bacterium]
MWATDTLWFEIAVVSIIFTIGNIAFGHFEEHTPKYRRIGKYILTTIVIVFLSNYFNRTTAMVILGLLFIPVIYIHAIDLPKKGINGWTGEPKDKYYELRGWDKGKLKK